MQPGTVALVGLGVVGAGAAVYFLVIRPRQAGGMATGIPKGGAAVSTGTGKSVPVATGGVFSMDHVDRKNAIAPMVLTQFGVPASIAGKAASIAGKLDASAYAERAVKRIPVVGTVAAIPTKVASSVFHGITSLF